MIVFDQDGVEQAGAVIVTTAATDGEHIAASFGHGIVCMDMEGKVLWEKMEPMYMTHLRYGANASPLIHQDRVERLTDGRIGQGCLAQAPDPEVDIVGR